MRIAIVNVRPLLIKWGALYVGLVFIYSGWTVNNAVVSHNIRKSEQASPIQPRRSSSEEKIKPVTTRLQNPAMVTQTVDTTPKPAEPPAPVAPAQPPVIPGNPYARGHCTWYAKSKRPDLPNNLGNANTWAIRAKAQGIATGAVPKEGAIAQRGMHVVYVESLNPDGTMNISEMNYIGLGKRSERMVATAGHQFIYR